MLQRFILDNHDADVAQLALHRERYPMLSDSDFRYGLQQIDGRQRTKDKLPTFASIPGWIYPPRLNLEQCSSERTARFKASLLSSVTGHFSPFTLIDATGGYGVDTFFMSAEAQQTHYFEQNTELATIAEHNFRLAGKTIHCHPEPFTVQSLSTFDFRLSTVLYLDPARRDSHGGKVFRLADCTPNVIEIIRSIRLIREQKICVLLKLSPMLDFHQAIAQLGGNWDIYIVSVNNEAKELLLLSDGTGQINAVMLTDDGDPVFSFTPDEESSAEVRYISSACVNSADSVLNDLPTYVYEPDAALLKAGAFRLLSARYGLLKAAANTHLYFADTTEAFRALPLAGRIWQIVGVYARTKEVQRVLTHANIITRNYVLPVDALRKQLKLKDGGDDYIIGCRVADKPLLLHCRRCQL